MTVRVGELFAGIGGFGLAAQRAGCEVAWASEIDDFATRVYAARFPNVPQLGDVRAIEPTPIDLITAGFPCQDLSVAGKRKGLIGERSGLFWEIIRIAKRLRPRWLLLENVPGLLSSHRGRDFETVLAALDECGHGVAWRVLDAQFFGVPQRRRRVFIVGHLGGPCPAEVLFEPEGVQGDSAASRKAGAGATGDVAACLNSGGNDGGFRTEPGEHVVTTIPSDHNIAIAQPLRANRWGGSDSHGDEGNTVLAHALRAEGADASEDGTGRGTPIVAAPLTSSFAKHHGASAGKDAYPHNLVNETRPRRLTPRECERLQGFPDDWTLIDGASDSARYRALGNAVAVPCVEWIIRRLKAAA